MNDELDHYISRCMKNWAARYPIRKDGRERLMRAAAFSPGMVEDNLPWSLVDVLIKFFAPQNHDYQFIPPLDGTISTPFSIDQIWSWEFAPSWRLSA